MGRKTFQALGRVLPERKHIIFSQNPDFKVDDPNVEIVHSMLQIQEYIENDEPYCMATRELESCNCDGDRSKCNFYMCRDKKDEKEKD